MVRNELKYAEDIRRRNVEPENRTTKRDEAAEWIEKNVLEHGRWNQITMVEMAEQSGWSRQHIANTLEHYFEPADDGVDTKIGGFDIDLLLHVYREGYQDGMADARTDDAREEQGFNKAIEQFR